jgi:hypothetical protein
LNDARLYRADQLSPGQGAVESDDPMEQALLRLDLLTRNLSGFGLTAKAAARLQCLIVASNDDNGLPVQHVTEWERGAAILTARGEGPARAAEPCLLSRVHVLEWRP